MAKMSNGVILRIPPSCAPRGGGVPLDARAAWGGCHSLCYLRGWRTCGVRSIPPAWLDGVLGSTVARPASEDFVQRRDVADDLEVVFKRIAALRLRP